MLWSARQKLTPSRKPVQTMGHKRTEPNKNADNQNGKTSMTDKPICAFVLELGVDYYNEYGKSNTWIAGSQSRGCLA